MGFQPEEDYIETKWRDALYAIQSVLEPLPTVPVGRDVQSVYALERAPWTQLPRWIEEFQDEDTTVSKVVDLGSGRGVMLTLCRQILSGGPKLVAVEADQDAIDYVTLQTYDIHLVADNVETMVNWSELKDAHIVIMSELLQYLKYNAYDTLRKIHSIMRDDGILLLSTPDAADKGRTYKFRDSPKAETGADPSISLEPQWYFNRAEVQALLVTAGFKIDRFAFAGIGVKHFNYQVSKAK